jgi:hypothetical protein
MAYGERGGRIDVVWKRSVSRCGRLYPRIDSLTDTEEEKRDGKKETEEERKGKDAKRKEIRRNLNRFVAVKVGV